MNIVAFQFCNSRVKGSRGGERAELGGRGDDEEKCAGDEADEPRREAERAAVCVLVTVRYKHQKGGFLLFAHDLSQSLVGEVTVATSRSRRTQVTKHAR